MVVRCGPSHDVMGRGSSLSEYNAYHGHIGLLNGVYERLSQGQQFRLFRNVSHIDAARVLKPDDGNPVSPAEGDEFIQLDQSLAVELSPYAWIGCILGIVLAQKSLSIANKPHQKTINLGQSGINFRTIIRSEFHVLAIIKKPGQHLVKVVTPLLVKGHDVVNVLPGKFGLFGDIHPEEVGVVSWHHIHVLFQSVEDTLLRVIDLLKKPRFIMVDGNAPRWHLLEMTRGVNQLFRTLLIKISLGAHPTHNATPSNGDVRVLVSQKDSGANPLISPTGRVRPIYASQNGHTQFFQFGMTKKGGPVSPPIGIDLLLFSEFHAAAIDDPDKGHVKPFCHVSNPELVICLPRNPGSGHHLVIETDHHGPFTADLGEPINDPSRSLVVELRVV